MLYGYQGADRDAEKFALTDQLLDAKNGKHGVVAREQPCLIVVQCGAHQNPMPGRRDLGWALG